MITGKIILKSATKLSLDQRFTEIAKHPPTTPARIQQQTHVIIPRTRQELFANSRRSNTLSIAQRLKKRSINYRLGRNNNNNNNHANVNQVLPKRPRVFQRLGFNNRRQQGGNSYLFGGQSGLGVRLRGQGRINGPRRKSFRSQTRGYLNNKMISRVNRNSNNNNNNRGKRFGGAGNNRRTRFNRGKQNIQRTRSQNKKNVSKDTLDNDLDKYMSQTKIENDSVDMNAV